jgi:hypothetical protein
LHFDVGGYRADDYGNSYSTAKNARLFGTQISHEGIIGTTTDRDYFVFSTTGGQVSVQVSVPVRHRQSWYVKIASDGDTLDTINLGAQINVTVGAGTYYLVVGSFQAYGDVGQYTLAGTLPPAPLPPLTALPVVINPPPTSTPHSVVTQHLQIPPTEQARSLAAGADHLSPGESLHHEVVRLGTQLESRHLHVETLDRLLEQKGTDEFLNELLSAWW